MAEKTKEEMEREDKARKDAAEKEKRWDETLDMVLKGVDSVTKRMDAVCAKMDAAEEEEKKRADAAKKDAEEAEGKEKEEAEKLAADKARKDAEEKKEEEEKKADAVRGDAVSDLAKKLEEANKKIDALVAASPRQVSDEEWRKLGEYQARADEALIPLGRRAPRPMVGEAPLAYRRRMADLLRPYSSRWKDIELSAMRDDAFEKTVEEQIYADAAIAARSPTDLTDGTIRAVQKPSRSGHMVTEFVGSTHFVRQFSRPARRVTIRDPQSFRSH